MLISYRKNYIKIYFWQSISIVLNLLSMVVVIPKLTGNATEYGVYMTCISLTIFLSYADLGFISAAYKYAGESYARSNKKEEIKYIAFSSFLLFCFIILFAALVFLVSFNPRLIFKGIAFSEMSLAGNLLRILAVFSFSILLQRILQIIYGIRLEDYIYQRINIGGSLLKLLSVFYFFSDTNYDIIGYFLFSQAIGLFSGIISLIIIKYRYKYNFNYFIRQFRFSMELFNRIKGLAFGTVLLMTSWILYYELDSIAIGKLLGAESVAIFSIGLTIISFFRSLLGTLYGPFNARFNHFIGVGDMEGLRTLLHKILIITLPITILPIICMVCLIDNIVLCWVGNTYIESIDSAVFLILCNSFSFIAYPAGSLTIALKMIKKLNYLSVLSVIIYWLGIFFTYKSYGVISFAFFKFMVFSISAIFYITILMDFLEMNLFTFIKKYFVGILIPIIILILMLLLIKGELPIMKNKTSLLITITVGVFGVGISNLIYYFINHEYRLQVKSFIKQKK